MKTIAAALAALVALALISTAAAAVKPKRWQWTPAKVVLHLKASSPIVDGDVGSAVLSASCTGKGKAVSARYSRFVCQTRYGGPNGFYDATLTLRVLAIGSGKLCVVTTTSTAGAVVAVPYRAGTGGVKIVPTRACP